MDAILKYDEDSILTGSSDGLIRIVSVQPNKMLGVLGEHAGRWRYMGPACGAALWGQFAFGWGMFALSGGHCKPEAERVCWAGLTERVAESQWVGSASRCVAVVA